jgi:IS5 family transposase
MDSAQQGFGLSDEGIEDAIYDSQAIRGFIGIDLNMEIAPDAMTLLKSHCLLEENNLTERIFTAINSLLAAKGLLLREGATEDTTIIDADCSTKNRDSQRVPKAFSAEISEFSRFFLKPAPFGFFAKRRQHKEILT